MKSQPAKKANRPMVYGKADDQCVWSRAGVIKSMKCINAFDCLGCSLDRKVQAGFESKAAPRGAETLRTPRMRMLGGQLKCRHMLSGRVGYKLCAHNYNCVKCPYYRNIQENIRVFILSCFRDERA